MQGKEGGLKRGPTGKGNLRPDPQGAQMLPMELKCYKGPLGGKG